MKVIIPLLYTLLIPLAATACGYMTEPLCAAAVDSQSHGSMLTVSQINKHQLAM